MPSTKIESQRYREGMFWLSASVFFTSAICGLILVYLWLLNPGAAVTSKSWEVEEATVIEWMQQSAEAEQRFERAWNASPDDPEVFESLELALEYQFRLRTVDPGNDFGTVTRLEYLLDRLEATKGKLWYSNARASAARAMELIESGDHFTAITLLRSALENQEWINSQLPDSKLVDPSEATRLLRLLEKLEAMDSSVEVGRLVEAARSAFSDGDWDLAGEFYDRAISIQDSINLNMPDSSLARWKFVQELKNQRRKIEGEELTQRIESILAAPSPYESSYERALNLQLHVNEKFPNTHYYNLDRVSQLRERLITGQSRANADLLVEQQKYLNSALRQKAWDEVKSTLLEMENSLKGFVERFSPSLLPDDEIMVRIEWMLGRIDQLPGLYREVGKKLKRHPLGDFYMCESEVDQALYENVMGSNPSRWLGESHPVDSVGLDEAVEFCKRLELVLGRPVVLPRVEWFSVIELSETKAAEVWFSNRSEFRSQPIATSSALGDFYDVYGNLAEWSRGGEKSDEFYLFGGSGADDYKEVIKNPIFEVAPNFRSRWVGFRFCVLD